MHITWHGQSCFKIQGQNVTIITDPFDKSYGLKVPRMAADIITSSHDHNDHNNVKAVKGIDESSPFIITGSGEYEVKDVFVYGIPCFHDKNEGQDRGENTIYRIEIDNLTLVHLGDLGHAFANGQLEKLKQVDILFVPVGGVYTIDAKAASEVISQIEPRIVIPMHYQIPGLKLKLDSLDKFCKEIGVCPTEKLAKLKIAKKDLPAEDMKVVVLNKS